MPGLSKTVHHHRDDVARPSVPADVSVYDRYSFDSGLEGGLVS
jgi:hypothetical protein